MRAASPRPRPECLRCRRPASVCLCAWIRPAAPRSKFVFLTHPKEARKTKNGSGRLAHLGLEGSELIVGTDFDDDPRVQRLLADPTLDCRLLYPSSDPPPGPPPTGVTPVVFVVDATWQCAKKMVKLSATLHGLPRLGVDTTAPSRFVIKHQPDPRCLATIEAVDRLLRALDARGEETWDDAASAALLRPFERMNELALAHAAAPGPKSYRPSRGFKAPVRRARRTAARNVMFRG